MVRFPRWLTVFLVALIVVGVGFRFVNLNHKVFSQTEVDTTIRAAGYTQAEVDQELFQNQPLAAITLQQYQQIKPGSNAIDTVRSLAVEASHHPPLYFLIARGWMQTLGDVLTRLFNSPLTVMRSLPAVLSLLALPAMYGCAWELFASHPVSLLATALVALSPADAIFAQTARQYSLMTVLVIGSSFLLLRAIRQFQTTASQSATAQRHALRQPITWLNWGCYGLALILGLYTHPLFTLTLISHILYIGACFVWDAQFKKHRRSILQFFVGAIVVAILCFSPWIVVMLVKPQSFGSGIYWSQPSSELANVLKQATQSLALPFIDFGFQNLFTTWLQVLCLLLIGISLYILCRHTLFVTWSFVLLWIAIPLLLAVPGLIWGNNRVVLSRYLLLGYPGIQLAVAYFLATRLSMKRVYSGRSRLLTRNYSPYKLQSDPLAIWQTWVWRGVLGGAIAASLASLILSAASYTWWDKGVSATNYQTVDFLNEITDPILVSDKGDIVTNTGDLISLSYHLKETVQLLPLRNSDFVESQEFQTKLQGKNAIAFRPSQTLQQALEEQYGQLAQILSTKQLWKISVTAPQKIEKSQKN
ncbi:MAG: glycosyl transferase family 39 [Leptolyngbyaceae cyanobacterium bins.302]|nr:glycosyl transferase family 39 [Leptolyngbyaceae cyanobacterium bins.302]